VAHRLIVGGYRRVLFLRSRRRVFLAAVAVDCIRLELVQRCIL
jgi:hypothetical protein